MPAFTPETIMLAICLKIFVKKITNYTFMYFRYLFEIKHFGWLRSQNSSVTWYYLLERGDGIPIVDFNHQMLQLQGPSETSIIQTFHFKAKIPRPKEVKQLDCGHNAIFQQRQNRKSSFLTCPALFVLTLSSHWETLFSRETQLWNYSWWRPEV